MTVSLEMDLEAARHLGSATLHEASGKAGALPSAIVNRTPGLTVAGTAFTVACQPGDNLRLHHAIYRAAPGSVIVANMGDDREGHGYWGEVMAHAAVARRLAGLVITGGVRDVARLESIGFPTFSGSVCIRGTSKDPSRPGALGAPVTIGGVTVATGDLVVGDADGVVVIPADRVADVIEVGKRREADEAALIQQLRAGRSTLELFDLPAVDN